ncbi:MAG: hypothetical protein PVF58_06395 [Candidatus Methanofastidiosia archaeon]|jgi:hypothetical protein
MDKKVIATFLISSLLLYSALSFWRWHSVEQTMEEETLSLKKERTKILEAVREDKEAYLNALPTKSYVDPLWDIFQDSQVNEFVINSHIQVKELELHYRTEFLPDVLAKNEIPLSPYTLFHAYGKLYSFDNVRFFIGSGTFLGWNKLGPYLEHDIFSQMAATIEEWEPDNKVKEEWFQEFQKSSQYAAFVDSLLQEIKSFESGKPVDEMVAEIQNIPVKNSLNPCTIMKSHFLKDAKSITNMIYNSYNMHIDKKDFISAHMDAWIIYSIWRRAHYVETMTYNYYDLKESGFFPDPAVDIAVVVVVALMIASIFRYYLKGTLKIIAV